MVLKLTLLQPGISEIVFYCDVVYKFKIIVGKLNLSDKFKKIIKHYKQIGRNNSRSSSA